MTMCAERVATFSAIAAGERSILAVAIVTEATEATPPCGGCRQVLWEFGPRAAVVSEARRDRKSWGLADLLPDAFGPSSFAPESSGRTEPT
jgi:cytidine deaminase